MHNLSGVFLQEEMPQTIDGVNFYSFSVVYPKKTRHYYVDNLHEYKGWVAAIVKATGYADLADIYEVKEKLGNGKFGLVRLGIHKQTGRKVAIKIMNKKDMSTQDLELVKTEIDTLKICQHPNIIKLYDVFENVQYIYLSKLCLLTL
jgi:serine/threonine protein kinase